MPAGGKHLSESGGVGILPHGTQFPSENLQEVSAGDDTTLKKDCRTGKAGMKTDRLQTNGNTSRGTIPVAHRQAADDHQYRGQSESRGWRFRRRSPGAPPSCDSRARSMAV